MEVRRGAELKWQKGIKITSWPVYINGLHPNCFFSDIKHCAALKGVNSFLAMFCCHWTNTFGSSPLCETGQLGIFIRFLYFRLAVCYGKSSFQVNSSNKFIFFSLIKAKLCSLCCHVYFSVKIWDWFGQ